MIARIFISLCVILSPIPSALACTTVNVPKSTHGLVGKTYDWNQKAGLVIVNKAKMAKKALLLSLTAFNQKAAEWTSKYGSITLNQYGRELPNSGMNEKGLVVEIMWLDDTKWPSIGNEPATSELQWVQYQLDNFASVKEMKAAADKIKISKIQGDVHFLACDSTKECATFEFLPSKADPKVGELVVNGRLKTLPTSTLTNDTYEKSIASFETFKKEWAEHPVELPADDGSISRFIRASYLAENFDVKDKDKEVSQVFDILTSVTVGDYTKWSVVYDPQELKIYFKTLDQTKVKSVNLKDSEVSFSCKTPLKVISINVDLEGDVTSKLEEYSTAKNRALLDEVLKGNPIAAIPGLVKKVSEYPESQKCVE
jgi:choloylglycine hydrolase